MQLMSHKDVNKLCMQNNWYGSVFTFFANMSQERKKKTIQ